MNRSTLLVALFAATSFAGLNLASSVPRLDLAKPGEIDLSSHGVLAHVCDGGFGGAIRVDLKRISDDEKFRIEIDPRVRTTGAVVLQQLPPGRYVATKLLLADRDPMPFSADTFEILAARITSFGKLKVGPELNLVGQMKRMVLKTDSVDITARLKAFHLFGVDSLAVTPKPISWLVEPQESTVGKRLSP